MADSCAVQGLPQPVRSISLPSKLDPISPNIEAELKNLKSWELSPATTTPLGAETIQIGLTRLAELYNCMEELIQSPHTQQALSHHRHGILVEEALEWSVELLDMCGTARDLFLAMKQQVQDLQSALRRRGADSSIESNIHVYICFRKKAKKDITKCLHALKRMESNVGVFPDLLDIIDHRIMMVIKFLRELRSIMISIFRSLFVFLSVPVMKTKAGGWSLISKLMLIGSVVSERGQKLFNEVGSVDYALYSLHRHIRKNDANADVRIAQRRLETLDASIKGLEVGLDCLFRRLIHHRVSLLNTLTP